MSQYGLEWFKLQKLQAHVEMMMMSFHVSYSYEKDLGEMFRFQHVSNNTKKAKE
jgi:hypothetical protein